MKGYYKHGKKYPSKWPTKPLWVGNIELLAYFEHFLMYGFTKKGQNSPKNEKFM